MSRISNLGLGLLLALIMISGIGCHKDQPQVIKNDISNLDHSLITTWYKQSLNLIDRTNGYTEPIAARAMSYIAYTLYEASVGGLQAYKSQQVILDGLQVTLPQADAGHEYNYALVVNEAIAYTVSELFGASGVANLAIVEGLRAKFERQYANGLALVVIADSKELGRKIGRAIINYADTDQQTYAYLENYPSYSMPSGPGMWVPTPPDYTEKPLLPKWGGVRTVLYADAILKSTKKLTFSQDDKSPMYAEAYECFALSNNLTQDQKNQIEFWDKVSDPHAAPLCRTHEMMIDLIIDQNLNYAQSLEALVRLSWAMHDGYVLAWKTKFVNNTLRPSSYIKSNISRFFIPSANAMPTPDYISENALLYKAAAEIFSNTFGYKFEFTDRTQEARANLKVKTKKFNSFEAWAKEAAYTDIMTAAHFRTSIDAGYELGYDLAQNIIAIPLK